MCVRKANSLYASVILSFETHFQEVQRHLVVSDSKCCCGELTQDLTMFRVNALLIEKGALCNLT